jgi:chemotaxis protein CheD
MELVAGMGEYVVSDRAEDVIRTFALASCVAVTAYSSVKRAAGMVHVVLPTPLDDKDRVTRPAYFAETGIPLLISAMCRKYGCRKEELVIQMYGGADSPQNQDIYNVGRKNIDAAKRALALLGLTARKSDLRGSQSRTITLDVRTGRVEVQRQPIPK